tara:strand:- start:5906 stop:6931 length:1026 start_codon:yes stop_codon:yes gene_type:complete
MIKIQRGFILLLTTVISAQAVQASEGLQERISEHYQAVTTDTLWQIARMFLRDPWVWPQIGQVNKHTSSPRFVYPNDVNSLVYIDDKPRLEVNRGRNQKLSPTKRPEGRQKAIAALPLDAIDNFLAKTCLTSIAELSVAPYVLGGYERRELMGIGDEIYARGDFTGHEPSYGVYRPGDSYIEPSSGEVLGLRAEYIGAARVKAVKDNIATLGATRSASEIRHKDLLLSREQCSHAATFYPRAPKHKIEGLVLNAEGGVRNAGPLDVVALNRGDRDGLLVGDTLAIYKAGEMVDDRDAAAEIRLPDKRIGLLMVFYVYEKMSFGLVTQADQQLISGDIVRDP